MVQWLRHINATGQSIGPYCHETAEDLIARHGMCIGVRVCGQSERERERERLRETERDRDKKKHKKDRKRRERERERENKTNLKNFTLGGSRLSPGATP